MKEELQHWIARRGTATFEGVPFGFALLLPNRRIVHTNGVLRDWLGYTPDELHHRRSLPDLFTMGGKIYYETHHYALESLQGMVRELSYTLRARDRSKVDVLVNTQRVGDEAGNHQYTEVYFFRFSERQKYEQELLRAKKMAEETARTKSQFLSRVSHDVRTPVQAVVALAGLLRETPLSDTQQELLRALNFNAEQMLDLINDLLDFNKLERRALALFPTNWALLPALQTFVYGLRSRLDGNRVRFEFDYDETLPAYVRADRKKLFQILGNLLGNALKFTEMGEVRFAVKRRPDPERLLVAFEVSDSGIGISDEQQAVIFEAFRQADPSISANYGGTGLGLSIVKELVTLHGGQLELESTLGRGTRFVCVLPLEPGTAPTPPPATASPSAVDLSNHRVLVAEDNETNVFILERLFQHWKLPFDRARTGREAVELVERNPYDLVLMDLQMPEVSGLDATIAIRHLEGGRYRDLPILIMTAGTEADVARALNEAGATDALEKAFDKEALLTTLRKYLPMPPLPPSERPPAERYSQLYDFFDGDPEDIRGYLAVVRNNWTQLRTKLQTSIEQRDAEAYGQIVHQMQTALKLLAFDTLSEQLTRTAGYVPTGTQHLPPFVVLLRTFDEALATLAALPDQIS